MFKENIENEESRTETILANFDSPKSFEEINISIYLREAEKTPLLTKEEEVYLAKRIEVGKVAQKELDKLNGSRSPKILKRKENLNQQVKEGQLAEDNFIRANALLVVSIANQYRSSWSVSFSDRIQEGNLGLMRAVEKYDWRKGRKFSTYATWWIRQTITRAIKNQSNTIRIPTDKFKTISMICRTMEELEQNLGREPNDKEIADKSGIKIKSVKKLRELIKGTISLEQCATREGDGDASLEEIIPDKSANLDDEYARKIIKRQKIDQAISTLNSRDQRIIRMRYGLGNNGDYGKDYYLREISKEVGVSRERIRQVQISALAKLRTELKSYC